MRKTRFLRLSIFLLLSASLNSLAQTPNINQQAVDTLTVEVARAVFGTLKSLPDNPTAAQIYNELILCGDSCDATAIIRRVGGYNPVEAKIQEISDLKNIPSFIAMSATDANEAIRKKLAQFYDHYKTDNNYSKSLNPTVQEQIFTKIDQLLPPSETKAAINLQNASDTTRDDEASKSPIAFQQSQLEATEKETSIWTMIFYAIAGLLVGGVAVYLGLYRAAKKEIEALLDENNRLRNALENAQRPKSGNEVNSIRVDYRQKAAAYDAIVAELKVDNPLMTIRQLKQQASSKRVSDTSATRASEPVVESNTPTEPEFMQTQAPITPLPPLESLPLLPRSELFYFPPPDPTGQFDLAQKSGTLSPESAYRFSVSSDNPLIASFRFEAEPGRVARFLTYRNYMIEPACESENSYTTTHTRIAMRRDGEAILENGIWRVKTKALIRYE